MQSNADRLKSQIKASENYIIELKTRYVGAMPTISKHEAKIVKWKKELSHVN